MTTELRQFRSPSPETTVDAVAKMVRFDSPTVEGADPDTGKVDCGATMTVDVPNNESFWRRSSRGVTPTGSDGNHLTFRLSYSVQKSADGKDLIYSLSNADGLASWLDSGILARHDAQAASKSAELSSADRRENSAVPDQALSETKVADNQPAGAGFDPDTLWYNITDVPNHRVMLGLGTIGKGPSGSDRMLVLDAYSGPKPSDQHGTIMNLEFDCGRKEFYPVMIRQLTEAGGLGLMSEINKGVRLGARDSSSAALMVKVVCEGEAELDQSRMYRGDTVDVLKGFWK